MTRMTRFAIVGSVVLIVLTFLGLAALYVKIRAADTEYVPTPDTRAGALQPFFVGPSHVEGVYGHEGIEAQLFIYASEAVADETAWDILNERAAGAGWELVQESPSVRVYERGGHGGEGRGREVVRVGLVAERGRVVVAWLRLTDPSMAEPNSGLDAEAWAAKYFWPQFDLKMRTRGQLPSETALDH